MGDFVFRGKRLDNGEWTQGYLFKIWERAFILWGMTNDVPSMIEVDPKTVSMFTGHTDKSGKQIFVDDIIHLRGADGADNYAVIKYGKFANQGNTDDQIAGFYVDDGRQCASIAFSCGEEALSDYIDVAGNLHDNPELLEKIGHV